MAVFEQIKQISGLNDLDFVRIVAQYTTIMTPREDLSARGYTKEQLAAMDRALGDKFNPVKICGLKFTKPFGHLKFEDFNLLLTLYENYDKGNLPFPGSVSEQPAQIIEMFSVIRQLKREFEIMARQEHERRQ